MPCSATNVASKVASPLQNRAWEDFRREVSTCAPYCLLGLEAYWNLHKV